MTESKHWGTMVDRMVKNTLSSWIVSTEKQGVFDYVCMY